MEESINELRSGIILIGGNRMSGFATLDQKETYNSMQHRYDNLEPEEEEVTKEEILELMTFSKKWKLAEQYIDTSDKDFKLAVATDIFNSWHLLSEIIDLIPHGRAFETEKYVNEVLIDNKLI